MEGGFGKYVGPSNAPRAQNPFGHLPHGPSHPPAFPRSSINYSDLDAPGVMRSPPLGFEQNLSARGSSHQFPRVQIRSDVHSANRNFSNPLRGRSPPSFQNSQLVGDQHLEREAPGRSDLHSGNRDFSNPLRGQSPPSFQNNQLFGGRHPEHEALRRPLSSPQWGNQSRPYNNRSTQLGLPIVPTARGSSQFGPTFQNRSAVVPLQNPARSPSPPNSWASPERSVIPLVGHKRSPVDYTDLDAPESKPSPPLTSKRSNFSGRDSRPFVGSQQPFSSPVWHQSQPRSSNTPSLSQENISPSLIGINQSGLKTEIKSANVPFPKRTRSPTPPYTPGAPLNSPFGPDAPRRSLNSQNYDHSSVSGQTKSIEVAEDELIDVPAVKKTKLPFELSPVQSFQENLNSSQESDRESQAKAKRLARFKDELSQPVNPTFPSQKQHLSASEKPRAPDALNMNMTDDIVSGNPDYESGALSSSIVGLCSDMCPESERAERQRKGDLDQYERLDGDRNMSSESLAVKKYNRTAEREAELIRPLHILQKTMEYLLNLLHQPYSDKFLGLYNFLWDRMRAIRMDLRMQHLFNKEAIFMLEQMIRLHIIAMHELCEYTKGEGFSEGFDAHLNIEQMNKASVELFQLYDDHRKKLIHVPSEREFRGYYALLKLDKHPGYKVEPAELSLDLAKMTPEMRQTPEVMFARDVARACRTGNFITFFRLAKKSSYLQACLMHAHFSKLRTQALASLHCGLQTNQGIPMVQVAKWLGMEEEDIENLLEYYGFSIKDFNKEPFMVKDNVFINVDKDFPVKRSKLVEKKQSRMICSDVSSSSVGEFRATEKVNKPLLKKDPVVRPTPVTFVPPVSVAEPTDEEMHDHYTSPSPKRDLRRPIPEASMHDYFTITSPKHNLQKPIHEASLSETMIGHQGLAATPSPIIPVDSPKNDRGSQSRVESSPKLSYDPIFRNSFGRNDHESQNRVESSPKLSFDPIIRNSFGRTTNHYMESTPSITSEEIKSPTSPVQDSSLTDPSLPLFAVDLELEEQNYAAEEEKTDEETTDYYDEEIVEAKLRLILRIWKRLTTKKRELRERKLLAANAALSSLSLGPLIWQYETQPDNHEVFDIDNITSERREMQEKSWSVMNPAEVVATKLSEKSPDSKCLCWKLILCPEDGEHTVQQAPSAVYSWLYSKLIPTNTTDNPDLLVSSHNLGIWRNWSTSPAGDDPTLCLSVIKSSKIEDWNKETVGTSAILFVLSPHAPLTLQKNRLQNIFTSIPYSSRLPLLIVSGSSEDESDSSTIAKELETYAIENSRLSSCHIIFLKDQKVKNMGGFFSNERLLEGIEWLASESRSQIVIREVKTRELVLSNLNSTLNILENSMGPHNIICSFNESVERSIEQISRAVNANPTSWPCPEISFLEEKSDEYCAASWYLPRIGWSSTSRKEALISVLNNIKLPTSEDDLSFLSRGFSNGNAIESPKLQFENLLIKYLSETTQIMDIHMAEKEARIMLQKYTGLELQNSSFYIVPKWTSIFRRIFNWRLMNLASASTYVLAEDDVTTPESLNRSELEYSMCLPSFDELVKASYDYERCMSVDYEAFRPPSTDDGVMLMENEDEIFENGLLNDVNNEVSTTRSSVEADKLNEMLKKCNILQNQIDKKLSFYF